MIMRRTARIAPAGGVVTPFSDPAVEAESFPGKADGLDPILQDLVFE